MAQESNTLPSLNDTYETDDSQIYRRFIHSAKELAFDVTSGEEFASCLEADEVCDGCFDPFAAILL